MASSNRLGFAMSPLGVNSPSGMYLFPFPSDSPTVNGQLGASKEDTAAGKGTIDGRVGVGHASFLGAQRVGQGARGCW